MPMKSRVPTFLGGLGAGLVLALAGNAFADANSKPVLPLEHILAFTDVFSQIKDCLLYTSPSPRDQRGSRMPSSA